MFLRLVLAVAVFAGAASPSAAAPITDLEFRVKAPNQGNWLAAVFANGSNTPSLTSAPALQWSPPTAFNNQPGTFNLSWDASTGSATFGVSVGGSMWTDTFTDPSLVGLSPQSVLFSGRDITDPTGHAGDLSVGVTGGPSYSPIPEGTGFSEPLTPGDPAAFSFDGSFLFTNLNETDKNANERLRFAVSLGDFADVSEAESMPEPATLTVFGLFGAGAAALGWRRRKNRHSPR